MQEKYLESLERPHSDHASWLLPWLSGPLRTWCCCPPWCSFPPRAGDFPHLLRPLSSCSCLLNVQFPSKCQPLYPIPWGMHPAPHQPSVLWRRSPETHTQPRSLPEHQVQVWDGFEENLHMNCIWRREDSNSGIGVEKGALEVKDEHGQRAETQNKQCLDHS